MFRTELPLTPHPTQLPPSARVLTMGSCFSDTIGGRLARNKVSTLVNPFGTVFNPLSACKLLRAAAGEEMDWQQHLVEARGRWQSYDLHATIGADSPVTLLQQIRDLLEQTGKFLETADVVVLTLGTAFAYRLLETQEVVSNCHKVAAEKFEKELLTPDEVINAVAETHAYLRLKNPKLRFILTVSPVRHLKDTLPLNSVSKSVLRVACHYLSELLPDVSYFPAYELLLDDLRDYRFYAEDMLHPSPVAENYVWERFTRTYFDQSFGRFKKEWELVQQALGHRPLYPAAPEHRSFLESTLERLQKLATQADLRQELREVQQQLDALPLPLQPQPLEEPEPDDDEERIDIGGADDSREEADVPAAPIRSREQNRPARTPAVEPAKVAPIPTPEPVEPEQELVEAPEEIPDELYSIDGQESEQPKKKRRSRGGAKRTARKHAARAAAEASQQQSVASVQPVAVELPEPAEPAATTPETPEIPLFKQELEVIHELPPVVEPAAEAKTVITPPAAPVEKVQREPNVDWLRPMKNEDEAPKPAKRPSKGIVRTPPTRKSTKTAIVAPPKATKAAAKPASPAPSRITGIAAEAAREVTPLPAPTAPVPTPEPTTTPLPAPVAAPAPTTADVALPAAAPKPKAAPKAPAAPKKAAAPKAKAAVPAKAAAAAPAKAPAKPKAPRAKPAAAPTPAVPAAAPEPTAPAPASKSRARPPRKKPTPPDEKA